MRAFASWSVGEGDREAVGKAMDALLVADDPERLYDSWAVVDRRDSTAEEVAAAVDAVMELFGLPAMTEEAAIWLTVDAALRTGQTDEEIVTTAKELVDLTPLSPQLLDLFLNFVADLDDDPDARLPVTRARLVEDLEAVRGPALVAVGEWASRSEDARRLIALTRRMEKEAR